VADDKILVSALCTVYEGGRFIRGWLEDLEAQTIRDRMEIVLVDSNSPDNEAEVVAEFQREFDNIIYLRTSFKENSHEGFNRACRAGSGKYFTLACIDDRHKADAYERMAAVLDSRPDIALTYANSYITRGENETFDNHKAVEVYRWIDFDPLQLLDGCFLGPQPMWRRELHECYGYMDETLHSAADWDFWLKMADKERYLHLDEFLGLYLYSDTSSEHKNPKRHACEIAAVRDRYAHREPALKARAKRQKKRQPAGVGTTIFIPRVTAASQEVDACVALTRQSVEQSDRASVRVVRLDADVAENTADAKVSPPTPILRLALQEAATWESKYVAVVAPDVALSEGWLESLTAALESDRALGVVGPMSNAAPQYQQVQAKEVGPSTFALSYGAQHKGEVDEAKYLGGFCLLFRSSALRKVGTLSEEFGYGDGIWELWKRFHAEGLKLAVARDVFALNGTFDDDDGMGYDAIARVEPVLNEHLEAANTCIESGDLPGAEDVFRSLVSYMPDEVTGYSGLATILLAQDRDQEALDALHEALKIEPENAELLDQLGVALIKTGDGQAAEEAFHNACQLNVRLTSAYLHLIGLYRMQEHYEMALNVLREAVRRFPGNGDVLAEFVSLKLEIGSAQAAHHSLEQLRAVAPNHPTIPNLEEAIRAAEAAGR
jgi:GT2 family glycosyltransferase